MEKKIKITFDVLLSSIIKTLEDTKGFTQKNFNLEYFDVTDATFRKWKNGDHFPSLSRNECIAIFQKISDQIFRGYYGDTGLFGRLIERLEEQNADLPEFYTERAADDPEAAAKFLEILITGIYRDHETQMIMRAKEIHGKTAQVGRRKKNGSGPVSGSRENGSGQQGNDDGRHEKDQEQQEKNSGQQADTAFLKEDAAKLTQKYGFLTKQMYQSDRFVTYRNRIQPDGTERETGLSPGEAGEENGRRMEEKDGISGAEEESGAFVFPVLCDGRLWERQILVRDKPEKMYEPPAFIREHEEELHHAHDGSFVYNNLNIRVDSWEEKENTFVMHTSRTKYFYSLLTNRAMDYRLKNGRTVRDELYDGPFPKDLSESELSNHLGFNGFLISSDGYVPLVKRRKDVSVEKGFYGDSVQASLKTRYALKDAKTPLKLSGIQNAVLMEIRDELKIPAEKIEDLRFLYAYRNLVEGGKPQLLFCARCAETKDAVQARFDEMYAGREGDINVDAAADTGGFLWIPVPDLKSEKLFVMPEGILYEGRRYPMVPSASAAVVMLIFWLRETKA